MVKKGLFSQINKKKKKALKGILQKKKFQMAHKDP